MRMQGTSGLAFGMIVISGKKSSHQHGAPSDKRIEDGDFVTMDFGATYEGCLTDMPRTVVVGHASQEQIDVHNTISVRRVRDLVREPMVIGLTTGIIFDVKKYSIHDGPGIRTTVFFKGCPLNCMWCHNPEGQAREPEVMFWPNRCTGCLTCVRSCPRGAIIQMNGALETMRDRCDLCGTCVRVCRYEARVIVGRSVTVAEVMDEIEKDVVFYDDSGGGVTFSGGEPLMQPEFLAGLLGLCKQREVRTAVDTCGFASKEAFLRISPKVDLFLYDLKAIDSRKHRELTGQPNEVILENLRVLSANHNNVVVRFPLIPGFNDDDETIDGIGNLVSSLSGGCSRRIDILPYHKIGADKYRRLGRTYALAEKSAPPAELTRSVAERFERFGLKTRIGG